MWLSVFVWWPVVVGTRNVRSLPILIMGISVRRIHSAAKNSSDHSLSHKLRSERSKQASERVCAAEREWVSETERASQWASWAREWMNERSGAREWMSECCGAREQMSEHSGRCERISERSRKRQQSERCGASESATDKQVP